MLSWEGRGGGGKVARSPPPPPTPPPPLLPPHPRTHLAHPDGVKERRRVEREELRVVRDRGEGLERLVERAGGRPAAVRQPEQAVREERAAAGDVEDVRVDLLRAGPPEEERRPRGEEGAEVAQEQRVRGDVGAPVLRGGGGGGGGGA